MDEIARTPAKLARDLFTLILSLTDTQPWLKAHQDRLGALMDECASADEQKLLCDLLSRFHYVDGDGFRQGLLEIAHQIERV